MINTLYDLNPSKDELLELGLWSYSRDEPMFTAEQYEADDSKYADIWSLLELRDEHEEAAKYGPLIPEDMKYPEGALGAINDVVTDEWVKELTRGMEN
ncbi:hypothetical protein [Chrysiogenes arsenatis]|uniref:hypothetical protein n=1 Tax=Chrysiogenes arsenatis TaxID=309797 RepID=UPI0003FCF390|nr:hypothetical protein [Chrysiogenes arsenatis]